MDLKAFSAAVAQISEEKGIPEGIVIETIENAIAAAYKKDYGKKGQIIRAKLDKESGELKLWQVKLVVDESMLRPEEPEEEEGAVESQRIEEEEFEEGEKKVRFNPEKHIMAEEAKEINPDLKPGDEVVFDLETREDFGRIAAQTAKQVILQRIREAERDAVYMEYKTKEDQVISAIIQRVEGRTVFFDIGKTTGVMLAKDQVPSENYRLGQRMRVYVIEVQMGPRGAVVYLSRSHPKMISRLFELEVPEITSGAVVIKSIAREAGDRTKVAVTATEDGIDPIGSMVGQRGTRVSAVINELGGEKVDIIEWDEDPERFVGKSLAPAKVLGVDKDKNRMIVTVSEDQLSLAIGKEGQNVRLAAKLTGWKIDIKSRESGQVKESVEASGEAKEDEAKESQEEVKEEAKTEKKKKAKKETKKAKEETLTAETPDEPSPKEEGSERE